MLQGTWEEVLEVRRLSDEVKPDGPKVGVD